MKLEWYEIALPILGALIGAAIGIYDYVKYKKPLWEEDDESSDYKHTIEMG